MIGGYPNEAVLAPGGVLSNLINPFGPQSAAGQALINSSYINGVYELGEDTRWSLDGHASHPLGDAFNAGTPATVALGVTVSGERFENATTPYNTLVSAATGLTDSAVEGESPDTGGFRRVGRADHQGPRSRRIGSPGPIQRFRHDQQREGVGALSADRFPDLQGNRLHRLPGAHALQPVLAAFPGSFEQRHHGRREPVLPPGHYNAEWTQPTCLAQGMGLYGGNTNLTPETSQNFDFGVVVSPIQDMGITLDYYRILLKNTIGTVPAIGHLR